MNGGFRFDRWLRRGFYATGIACLCLAATAWADPPVSSEAAETVSADVHRLVALRESVVDLSVATDRLDHQLRFPQPARYVAFYLGAEDGVRVSAIELSIDGGATTRLELQPAETEALQRRTLLRVVERGLPSGPHRLQSKVEFRDADGKPADAPVQMVDEFQKEDAALYLVLTANKAGTFSTQSTTLASLIQAPGPRTRGWISRRLVTLGLEGNGGQFVRGGQDDPEVRAAALLAQTDRRLSALVSLLRVADGQADQSLDPEYLPLLVDSMIEFGAVDRAASYLAAVDGMPAVRADELGRLHLRLAQQLWRNQLSGDSRAQLAVAARFYGKRRPAELEDLAASIDLADGRYGDAAAHLSSIPNDADYSSYVRYYNLGVALIRNGSTGQGETVLNRVGKLPRGNMLLDRVSDRANLTLAYHFLRRRSGGTAIPIFERVSSDGPFASRALLGLGWSWLAPPGDKVTQVARGDEIVVGPPPEDRVGGTGFTSDRNLYQRFDLRPFAREKLSSDAESNRKKALAIWSHLLDGPPADPAVAEGTAAVAVTLDQLGAHQDAVRFLELALKRFEDIDANIRQALVAVRDDRWLDNFVVSNCAATRTTEPGLNWQLQTLPPVWIGADVAEALAEEPIQAAIRDDCDSLLLRRELRRLAAGRRITPPTGTTEAGDDEADTAASFARVQTDLAESQRSVEAIVNTSRNRLQTLLAAALMKQQDAMIFLQRSVRFSLGRAYDGKSMSEP